MECRDFLLRTSCLTFIHWVHLLPFHSVHSLCDFVSLCVFTVCIRPNIQYRVSFAPLCAASIPPNLLYRVSSMRQAKEYMQCDTHFRMYTTAYILHIISCVRTSESTSTPQTIRIWKPQFFHVALSPLDQRNYQPGERRNQAQCSIWSFNWIKFVTFPNVWSH